MDLEVRRLEKVFYQKTQKRAGGQRRSRRTAAVGAGGGLVKSVIDKGDDVEIPANAAVDIVLTQPITVSASSYYCEN